MEFGQALQAAPEELRAYERWRDRYAQDESVCRKYEPVRRESLSKAHSGRMDERLVVRALSGLTTGARVLDAPCGGGRISRALRRRGYRAVAADYSAFMLAESRDSADLRCRSDLTCLPYRDAAFDAAVCFRFMQSAPREIRIRVLAELGRVATRVVVGYSNVYSFRGLRRFVFGGRPLTNRLSEEQVQQEVEASGLQVLGFVYNTRLFFEDFGVIAKQSPTK